MSSYPLPKFHFKVVWANGPTFGFTEVSGLSVTQEVMQYRDGGMNEMSPYKQAGMRKYSNITFKRGMFKDDLKFFEWWDSITIQNMTAGKHRKTVTVHLLDENHSPVLTWTIKNAFPIKFESPNLKADANEVSIETLEIAHEGFTLKKS